MSDEQTGDWYCKNCGYISDSRVTNSETCDECHIPVVFHTVDEMSEIERLHADLAAANKFIKGVPDRIKELSQFVDPIHHEKFHQLADVIKMFTENEAQGERDE